MKKWETRVDGSQKGGRRLGGRKMLTAKEIRDDDKSEEEVGKASQE